MFRRTRLTPLLLAGAVLGGCQDARDLVAPATDPGTLNAGIDSPDPPDTRDVNIDLAFGTVTIPGEPTERYGRVSALLTASLADAVREHGPFPGAGFDQVIDGFVGNLTNADFFADDLDYLGDPVDRLVELYNDILAAAGPGFEGELEITSLGSQTYNLVSCSDGSDVTVLSGSNGPGCAGGSTQGTATVNFYRVDLVLWRVNPQSVRDCKKGGWRTYGFRNQGQCIRFVNTGKDSRAM